MLTTTCLAEPAETEQIFWSGRRYWELNSGPALARQVLAQLSYIPSPTKDSYLMLVLTTFVQEKPLDYIKVEKIQLYQGFKHLIRLIKRGRPQTQG